MLIIAWFRIIIPFIAIAQPDKSTPYWIYFQDKGFHDRESLDTALNQLTSELTPKARKRRVRVGRAQLVDEMDLPVNLDYIKQVAVIDGVKIRISSRWLNAVSANLPSAELETVRRLPFVTDIKPVRRFIRHREENIIDDVPPDDRLPHRDWNLEYGLSLRQNIFLNAPELHDRGYSGHGVLVGLLDSGFDNLAHNCFRELDLLAAYDFVNDDDNVGDEGDIGEGSHGTKTLSIIAGYDPDQLIGIAYGATYVIAKTEVSIWERPVEEDYWVAGIEWMDELGVEVVSSSLSYMDWYDYEDLDGETAVTTIAAERAIDVGMIVVISMGNTGRNNYPHDKMGAPADGFRAFAIGSVDRDSSCSVFSSHGPTWDRRIKPDFTTLGSNVRFASSRNNDRYGGGLGTSFSAPAIAGLCALLLEANPYLSPLAIRDVLREVGNNNEEPDTLYGWGIPNGLTALGLAQPQEIELVIELIAGWNIVSHNLNIPAIDVRDVMAPVVERDSLVIVKDGQGRFYYPLMDFNNIPFWSQKEGYQIRVTEPAELVFEGQLVAYNTPMELNEGWQIIAYLPNFQMMAETAFRCLVEEGVLDIVKDEFGRFYFPEFDFNNIPSCQPSRGYQIKLNDDAVLVYPRIRHVDED